jgi:hypothetical protein
LTNLQPYKSALPISPLLAWLPAPSRPVLASLPKCASHAHLTLLQNASKKNFTNWNWWS